jgi:hypothetical protein
MPAIVATVVPNFGDYAVTETILTAGATNPLVYTPGTGQVLTLRNPTAGALTPTIIGSGSVAQTVARVGTVNYAAGFAFGTAIPAGGTRSIQLDQIPDWLVGTVNVTNGVGLAASLINRS